MATLGVKMLIHRKNVNLFLEELVKSFHCMFDEYKYSKCMVSKNNTTECNDVVI